MKLGEEALIKGRNLFLISPAYDPVMPTRNSRLLVTKATATGGMRANRGKMQLRVHQEYMRPGREDNN